MHSGTESVWMREVSLPRFPALDAPGDLDVLVVGGGISGLTTALLLQRAGYRTAVLEQHHLASGETARTSAHLTAFVDLGFAALINEFGVDAARGVVRSKHDALDQIEQLAGEVGCDFVRVPGYLYAETDDDVDRLDSELAAARQLGVTADRVQSAPLPFPTAGALALSDQARFHPLKYLAGLVRLYAQAGGTISELTHVRGIDEVDGACRVRTDRSLVHGRYVVAMTDAPLAAGGLLDTKLRANRTYLLALETTQPDALAGLYWDTFEPYHYIRDIVTGDGRLILVGGEDHRVGTDVEVDALLRLEHYAHERFDRARVRHRWSGQIMEPVDGLPYIGAREPQSQVFVATGYSGNGLTYGTVAAQLVTDAIAGRQNAYAPLYAPDRPLGAKQWAKYAAQNLPAAWTLVTDRLPLVSKTAIDDLKAGEGALVRVGGEKAAAARDFDGTVHIVSSTCTHMGCEVAWNPVEHTWDCPCHGSRYRIDGTVLHGPASAPLEAIVPTVRDAPD